MSIDREAFPEAARTAICAELESILHELTWDTARGPAARLRELLERMGHSITPAARGPQRELDCALLDQTYALAADHAEAVTD